MSARPNTVLFLCSGNYCRSRFAEHLFNCQAEKTGLGWRAQSRGLAVDPTDNIGPISAFAREGLRVRGILLPDSGRVPLQLTLADLEAATLVIALKEREHRQMLVAQFPDWSDRVEYWHIDDLDCAGPETALMQLEQMLDALLRRLGSQIVGMPSPTS